MVIVMIRVTVMERGIVKVVVMAIERVEKTISNDGTKNMQ